MHNPKTLVHPQPMAGPSRSIEGPVWTRAWLQAVVRRVVLGRLGVARPQLVSRQLSQSKKQPQLKDVSFQCMTKFTTNKKKRKKKNKLKDIQDLKNFNKNLEPFQ